MILLEVRDCSFLIKGLIKMSKSGRCKKKEKINIFNLYNENSLIFTNHFFDRFNQRVSSSMEKDEIIDIVKQQHRLGKITHIDEDYYLFNNILFIAKAEDSKIVLVSVIGDIYENMIIYNALINGGAKKLAYYNKFYGKLTIA